jgi:peptidoglycan DL-endopeptidase CwlO
VTLSAVRVRSILAAVLVLAIAATVGAAPPTRVFAAPGAGVLTADPEGGSKELSDQLDAASAGFNDAAARLNASRARQAKLADQTKVTETQLAELTDQVGALAATAYKTGRVGGLSALLDSSSPDGLLQRAVSLQTKTRLDDEELRRLKATRATLTSQRAALDNEIKVQTDQLAEMDRRRKAAEQALVAAGGGAKTGGISASGTASATPVPRRADGTLASESCAVKDPTTSGCITQRMLHAYQQVQAAGFTHFASCYRSQEDGGEHPRGRACDFAAAPSGFGGVATGPDRDYGNRLAAWMIANATNLGVLYIIWFRQIWMPSTGWRAYTRGNGDPSSDHTNHVHLSVQ